MTHEVTMLGWTVVLGLVYIMTAAALSSSQRGLMWNAGNRDGLVPPLTGAAARAGRALANFMETFPLFAGALLGVVAVQKASHQSAIGADLYFWARLVYLPTYIVGIPYLRTAVWLVSLVGLILELSTLLR